MYKLDEMCYNLFIECFTSEEELDFIECEQNDFE